MLTIIKAIIRCSTVVLTFFSCLHSQSGLQNVDEVRIKTKDRTMLHGELQMNNKGFLASWSDRVRLHAFAVSDLETDNRIKRSTRSGVLIGVVPGTGLGIVIAGDGIGSLNGHRIQTVDKFDLRSGSKYGDFRYPACCAEYQ